MAKLLICIETIEGDGRIVDAVHRNYYTIEADEYPDVIMDPEELTRLEAPIYRRTYNGPGYATRTNYSSLSSL